MARSPKTIAFWWGRLPHWEVENGRYFITIHLTGAIPAQGRRRVRQIADELRLAAENDRLRLQRAVFAEMERWLDHSQWNPLLSRSDVAEMVVESIEHRQKIGRWNLLEYVVMPTHVHLFCEVGDQSLKQIVEDFKRWTGHQAAKMLKIDGDRFWQRDWFDHWSRSDAEDARIAQYIRNNPVVAGLVSDPREWKYGSRR